MASLTDIRDAIDKLSAIWQNANSASGKFGITLTSVALRGVRGITATIDLPWPVVAISGTNGSGKTTVIQVCTTAFREPGANRIYRLGDWIRNNLQGDTPALSVNAKVSFTFSDPKHNYDSSYIAHDSRWAYPSKVTTPERHVGFVGIAPFAPRIEQKDRVAVFKARLQSRAAQGYPAPMVASISKIMNSPYSGGASHEVGLDLGVWRDTLHQLKRGQIAYSEPHMGAGEQKVVRMIQTLESLPERSLILLEEPEITLHGDAQRGLAWYLMDFSRRKGHQVIIATHSNEIYETLPPVARVMLVRSPVGIEVLYGVSRLRAARELNHILQSRQAVIFVEDEVGARLLTEVLRQFEKPILDNCAIIPVGNNDDVRKMTASFRAAKIHAIGVRDGDTGQDMKSSLVSLPGGKAPETILLDPANLAIAEKYVNTIREAYARAEVVAQNLTGTARDKAIFKILPAEVGLDADLLADRLTLAWVDGSRTKAERLAANIKQILDTDL